MVKHQGKKVKNQPATIYENCENSSEDERMKAILDEDTANVHQQSGDMFRSTSSSSRLPRNSASSVVSSASVGSYSGRTHSHHHRRHHDAAVSASVAASSTSISDSLLVDFNDGEDDGTECSTSSSTQSHGILSTISRNLIPIQFHSSREQQRASTARRRKNNNGQQKQQQRRKKHGFLPFVLLSLILYGSISMIMDVINSIHNLHQMKQSLGGDGDTTNAGIVKSKRAGVGNSNSAQFRIGARSMDMAMGTSSSQLKWSDGGSDLQLQSSSSSSSSPQLFAPIEQFKKNFPKNIDKNNPTTPQDVSIITEHILSTIFGNALELESEAQPNEIQFFWTIGATPGLGPAGRFPAKIAKCFPNVVQAGSGAGEREGVAEEELRGFAKELRVLQHLVPISGGKGDEEAIVEVEGVRYVNVDLFTSDGVRRAADLGLLFPDRPFPMVYEHDHTHVVGSMDNGAAGNIAEDGTSSTIMASSQIHLMESGFLPEIMGLFAPPPTWKGKKGVPFPKARIHAIFPPAAIRVSLYYKYHKNDLLAGVSYLQFVTSSSNVVNNYVTRTLSGQWEEGSPLTEVHLEIAKNVISRKIHLWPNQGMKDMLLNWVERCGWQEGAMQFHHTLVNEYGDVKMLSDLVLGLDCVFPPVDENEAPKAAPPKKPEPSELDAEIKKIMDERNGLDGQLFQYAMQVYRSWVATSTSKST